MASKITKLVDTIEKAGGSAQGVTACLRRLIAV
jgi:hypothetical protein